MRLKEARREAGLRACLISQRVRIGEIDFLPCKAKSRRNPYRAMTPSRGHAR